MLPLSNQNLNVKPSRDFLKLTLLVNGLCAVVIIHSSLPMFGRVLGLFVVFLGFIKLFQNRHQLAQLTCINFNGDHWYLQCKDKLPQQFESLSIQFDGGFYFILKLSNHEQVKRLIIFKDQLTHQDCRRLVSLNRVMVE